MYIFGSLHEARNVTIISATILIPSRSRRNSFPRELKLTSIFLIDSRDFSPRFILIITTKEEAHFLWSKINRYTSRSVPLRAERPVKFVKKEKEKERTNERIGMQDKESRSKRAKSVCFP